MEQKSRRHASGDAQACSYLSLVQGQDGVRYSEGFPLEQRYNFASVNIRNDRDVLAKSFLKIPRECHIDLQEKLMIKGGVLRDSMADLAGAVIDKSDLTMKTSFPKGQHDYWEWKPLSLDHLKYAAIVSKNFVFYDFMYLYFCFIATIVPFPLYVYLHFHPFLF